jgi:hypothetical protein
MRQPATTPVLLDLDTFGDTHGHTFDRHGEFRAG